MAEKAKKRHAAHESAAARYRAKHHHSGSVKQNEPLSAAEAEAEEYKSSSVRDPHPSTKTDLRVNLCLEQRLEPTPAVLRLAVSPASRAHYGPATLLQRTGAGNRRDKQPPLLTPDFGTVPNAGVWAYHLTRCHRDGDGGQCPRGDCRRG